MKPHEGQMSRRRLLRQAAAAGVAVAAPMIIPARALGKDGAVAPSERIVFGAIGIGNRGSYVFSCFLQEPEVQCVAVCDIKAVRRDAAKKSADARNGNNAVTTYSDLRELL